MLLSPIHCCDVMKPPYLLSGKLCTSPLHSNRLYVYTVCCWRGGQCFSVPRKRHTDVVGNSSGRSYVTEQGHNVPLLQTCGISIKFCNSETCRHMPNNNIKQKSSKPMKFRSVYNNVSFAVAWLGQIPGRVRNLIPVQELGVCPLSVLSSAETLTLCWPHIQGGPRLCICLVFCGKDCCSLYRHLTHRHLACKSLGVQVIDWGRMKKEEDIIIMWPGTECYIIILQTQVSHLFKAGTFFELIHSNFNCVESEFVK